VHYFDPFTQPGQAGIEYYGINHVQT
jgi:hypothetical protein